MINLLAQSASPMSQLPFMLLWIGGMLVILYFITIRPQQKTESLRKKMLAALKRGDRVLTSGGMYGTVMAVKEDVVVLKFSEEAKAEFRRAAIVSVEKSAGE